MSHIHLFAGVYAVPQIMPRKGDKVEGHEHPHDHMSVVIKGRVEVRWNYSAAAWAALAAVGQADKRTQTGAMQFSQGDWFPVLAGVTHEYEALEDDTEVACVHARRDVAGEVIGAPEWSDYLGGAERG